MFLVIEDLGRVYHKFANKQIILRDKYLQFIIIFLTLNYILSPKIQQDIPQDFDSSKPNYSGSTQK
jgi:hypothetical protein